VFAQTKSLTVGDVTGPSATVAVTMTSDEDVQGFVLSVGYQPDPSLVTTLDVRAAGATIANGAELIIGEILAEGFTLGVVMDFNPPYAGQVIPAGTGLLIAEADVDASAAAAGLVPGDATTVNVVLQDGLNTPPLANILVVDGMSISAAEGLVLDSGVMTIIGKGDQVRIVSASGVSNTAVPVRVEVENTEPVEAFVLSIAHDPAITLEEVTTAGTSAGAVGAEFEVARIYPNGGTIGVVLDFEPPYAGQTLPVGINSMAIFRYRTSSFQCPAAAVSYNLTFVDEVFGSPPLSNVLVQGGMSIPPDVVNGTVTFTCAGVPPEPPPEGIQFYIGADTGGETPQLTCAVGAAGAEVLVNLYYTSTEVPIQGLSMAVCFPPVLNVADLDATGQGIVTDKQLNGTITKGINAEFVSFQASNTKGELIVGILVDATPPVPINHMYPPIDTLGRVLTVAFEIPLDAECHTEYPLTFCDGITGAGTVPISNRVAVFNESYPADVSAGHGCITVGGSALFLRGDCNTDGVVDIADPAATMSYLFLGVYHPSCMDACDSNDDGVIDLADVVNTLRFLFKFGPEPPPPGPYVPGYDPTPDIYGLDLGCEAGDPCK